MLECIIFASGALLMILEMVGARVMAPYLGTSVIVWTSLIGVILACLAVGAFVGGRLADKKLSAVILARILGAAGLGCALTALGYRFVGQAVTSNVDNIYLSAVLATFCLFAFPAIFFGMVSPYIIRLRLADLSTSGATVGRLYALSTTGSIVGTFLGGFVLISFFSSTYILLGTAASMLVLALLALLTQKKSSQSLASQFVPLLLLLFSLPFIAFVNAQADELLRKQGTPPPVETPYNSIRISQGINADRRPVRLMATDPGFAQSGTYIDNNTELLFEYTQFYSLGTVLFPSTEKVLMLGGGGYSVPKWLLAGHGGLDSEKLRLDVVELDPGMTALAKQAFGLKEDARMRIFHEDARRFINTNTDKYDLIFVDVFNSHYSIPFHMTTVEAAAALRSGLQDDGAVMMNVISALEGEGSHLLQGIHGALQESFAHVYVFAVRPEMPRTAIQNLMVLALPMANASVQALINGEGDTRLSEGIKAKLATRVTQAIASDIKPLRDDFAPVEKYAQALLKK